MALNVLLPCKSENFKAALLVAWMNIIAFFFFCPKGLLCNENFCRHKRIHHKGGHNMLKVGRYPLAGCTHHVHDDTQPHLIT